MRKTTILLLSVLLLSVASSATWGCGGDEPQPEPSGNSGEGAVRLIDRVFTIYGSSESPLEVLVGEIPSGLPLDVPIPQDAEVVGSLVNWGGNENYLILVDVPGTPERAKSFYLERLTQAGWYSRDGFEYNQSLAEQASFCRQQNGGPFLRVTVHPLQQAQTTHVRLDLRTDSAGLYCRGEEDKYIYPCRGDEVLPYLTPPEGSIWGPGGCGTGGDQRFAQTTFQTELELTELHAYYQQILLEAEWKLEGQGSGIPLAWSVWSFIDDSDSDWVGFLQIHTMADGRSNQSFRASRLDAM